jgi:hypothetical protein
MFVIPFIAYQAELRFVCSLRRHHIWEIATKAGASQIELVFCNCVGPRLADLTNGCFECAEKESSGHQALKVARKRHEA